MKHLIFLTLIILSCSHEAQSQNEFYLAGYAGANVSQVSGDDAAGYNKFGAYAGLATGLEFKKDWRCEFGIMLSQKGAYNASRSNPNFKYLLTLTYIDVPVAFRYFFKVAHFEIGPVFSVLTTFKEKNALGNVNDPRSFNRFEVGAFAGVLYDINDRAGVLVRISNSLLPIREHIGGNTFRFNRGQYNTYISAAIRINF